jgi:hypothetical protein
MSDEASFDYERSDIESTNIAWLGAGLALFVIATPLLMPLVFSQVLLQRTPTAPPALSADAPRLEIQPTDNLRKFNRSEAQFLSSYDWVDRSHGIVRIPVEQAMQLLVEKGLPAWPSP